MTDAEDQADRTRANRALIVDEVEGYPSGTVFRVTYPFFGGISYNVCLRQSDGVLVCGGDPLPDGRISFSGPERPCSEVVRFGALDVEVWPW